MECEICSLPAASAPGGLICLRCSHSYCFECVTSLLNIGHLSRKLTFNYLFCPFRCGTCFSDSPQIKTNPELAALIAKGQATKLLVEQLALATYVTENALSHQPEAQDVEKAVELFPCYECTACHAVYTNGRERCGAAGTEELEDISAQYCMTCRSSLTILPGTAAIGSTSHQSAATAGAKKGLLTVFRKSQLNDSAASVRMAQSQCCGCSSKEAFLVPQLCDTDDNAAAQMAELEVILSIYPDEVKVLTPPPTKAGDTNMRIRMSAPIPDISDPEMKSNPIVLLLSREITFEFSMPSGYPESTAAMVYIRYGNLRISDVELKVRESLQKTLSAVLLDSVGMPSAYACMQAFVDWLQEVCPMFVDQCLRKALMASASWELTRECPQCRFGPVVLAPDARNRCADLTTWHGVGGCDNSCPMCGWFAPTFADWPKWKGDFLWDQKQLKGKSAAELVAIHREQAEKKRHAMCLIVSLRATARMCPVCRFGPIVKGYCDDLAAHHKEQRGGHSVISNACPSCKFFAPRWTDWLPWDGKNISTFYENT